MPGMQWAVACGIISGDNGLLNPLEITNREVATMILMRYMKLGTEEEETVTHLYVYGTETACTELAKDAVTPTLFDSVTFVNVVEGQELETSANDIVVNAYGIQTTDINGGKTNPSDVWSVLKMQ